VIFAIHGESNVTVSLVVGEDVTLDLLRAIAQDNDYLFALGFFKAVNSSQKKNETVDRG
jgi:hypothetical protein